MIVSPGPLGVEAGGIGDQEVNRGVAQSAAAGGLGVHREVAGLLQSAVEIAQTARQMDREAQAQGVARRVDRGGIGRRPGHGEVRFRGQRQQQGLEGVGGRLVVQRPSHGFGEALLADLVRTAVGAGRIRLRASPCPASQRLNRSVSEASRT